MATSQLLPNLVARLAVNPPIWAAQQRSVTPVSVMHKYCSVIWGGMYRVAGTVAVAGTPDVMVSRLVVLLDERTKRPVRSMFSSPAGAYDFTSVALGPWSVIAYDHTGEYNAVIASNKLGEPM